MDLKKLFSIFFIVSLAIIPALAQEEDDFEDIELQPFKEKKFDWSKLTIEPNIAFAYSNNFFLVGVAPFVGYEFAKNFYAGPGIVYYFSQQRKIPVYDINGALVNRVNINEQTAGGGLFAQYFFYKQAFVRTRLELLGRRLYSEIDPQSLEPVYRTPFVPVLLVGAGYNMSLGKQVQFPIMLSYDVLQDRNSPYSTGDFPFYIQIGFISYF